jgi:uncharacterized membrane protein
MKPLLAIIFLLAVGGLTFSGYLTYRELFAGGPEQCTPIGEPGSILGAPPCVFGFVMYLAIAVMASLALFRRGEAR